MSMPREVMCHPLSRAQQRLWILQQLAHCPYLYHIPVILPLASNIDVNLLKLAWQDVVNSEQVLQSGFTQQGQELFWRSEPFELEFENIEFEHALHRIVDVTTDARLAAFFLEPLSLGTPPLFRCGVLTTPQQQFLLLVVHHILVDGWSMCLLIQRLNHFYQCRVSGSTVIPEIKNSFAEHIGWEAAQKASYTEHLDYWLQRLQHKQMIIDLITDHPRRLPLSGQGQTLHYRLAEECVTSLRQLAAVAQCTLMQVILFGFSVLLNRFSGQDSLVIGIPMMGRTQQRWYQTVGLFVNTCLHAIDLAHHENILGHLQRIKQQLFSDMSHATIPFDDIVKALYACRQLDPKIQFNVLYNFLQLEDSSTTIGHGLPPYCVLPLSKFDLSLHVYAYPSHVDVLFEYSSDLYHLETVHSMVDYFLLLLQTMAEAKNGSLCDWIWQLTPVELG